MPDDELIPEQVQAIAHYWAGPEARIQAKDELTWWFRHNDPEDGFVYEVRAPESETPVYEDNGRPCGSVESAEWTVRALNDAPDSWWTVSINGIYRPWQGGEIEIW